MRVRTFRANCIRDNEEREWIGALIKKVRQGDITFTRKMYEEALARREETGAFLEKMDEDAVKEDNSESKEEGDSKSNL